RTDSAGGGRPGRSRAARSFALPAGLDGGLAGARRGQGVRTARGAAAMTAEQLETIEIRFGEAERRLRRIRTTIRRALAGETVDVAARVVPELAQIKTLLGDFIR